MENKNKIVKYWLTVADHDHDTMLALYKLRRYSDCLFFGHLCLEQILKALVVKQTEKQSPYTHDLMVLFKILKKIELSEEELDLLDDVNRFNIRARYPDFQLQFYKTCDAKYTKKYLEQIKKLYKRLCQKIK
jgi:HEPN domain-containing protein